jgi:hypothetical protein
MEELVYQPIKTYLGNSEDNISITNMDINTNSEENVTYSQSDHDELKINSINKAEPKNGNILKDEYILNIDTLQSLRISHSFEKSKNSQTLIDIINQGKYNFEENDNNKLNNENDMNIINKNNCDNSNISLNEKENKNSNIIKTAYNIKNNNESVSNIKTNNMTAITKNSIINNKTKIELNNNTNEINEFSLNNTNNKASSSHKYKIEEIFKEIYEEKIKPNSNKVSNDYDISINNLIINKNKNYDKYKLKPKTLEHQNKINYLLNCSSSSNNHFSEKESEKSSIVNKELELSKFVKNYEQKNSENEEDEVYENFIDEGEGTEIKNDFHNKKNKNEEKNTEENSELIIGMFGGKLDLLQDEEDKNIMISELDVELSNSMIEDNNNINKKINNEDIRLKNMNLEKEIETNFKKGNFNKYDGTKKINDNKNKNNIIKPDKLLWNYNCKVLKANEKVNKKSYRNKKLKNLETTKNKEEIHYNFENIIKKYKNSSLSVKLNNNNRNKNITDFKNIVYNPSSNASSFLALNTSSNNKKKVKNIIYSKVVYTDERIKGYKSPYSSKSNPKKKKIEEIYKNINPYIKKMNNSLSKDIKDILSERNNNKALKSLCTTSYNSNNVSYKEPYTIKKQILHSDNNTKLLNNMKNSIKYKKNFFEYPQDYYPPSKNNNSHFIETNNNSHNTCNNIINIHNLYKYEKNKNKNYSKIRKKNDIPICNINKNKIPFKRKTTDFKKTKLYSNNIKIKNKKNSANNVICRSKSYQCLDEQKNPDNHKYSLKFDNPFSALFNKHNNNKNMEIYNLYIKKNNNSNSHKNVYLNIKKQINNNKNNNNEDNFSFLLNYNKNDNTNNNINNNIIKNNSYLNHKFGKKSIINNNNFNKLKENINLLTEMYSKNYSHINSMIKTIRSKNEKTNKRFINDKIVSKNYIRNIRHTHNILKLNSFHIKNNNKEQNNKINSVLTTINNKKGINIKYSYSSRSSIKERKMIVRPKHLHDILNINKTQKNSPYNYLYK